MRTSIITLLLVVAPTAALANAKLDIKSSAFDANAAIPTRYTCDGAQVSPRLTWSTVPKDTKSIAVLVEDPDAPKGTFTHWLVTGITPTTRELTAGVALPEGAVAAKNDKGQAGYAGPCPPSGRHHYQFRVYALDIQLARAMTRSEFVSAIKGHVLAQGDLVGTYQRAR